jgi:hypothetical protein
MAGGKDKKKNKNKNKSSTPLQSPESVSNEKTPTAADEGDALGSPWALRMTEGSALPPASPDESGTQEEKRFAALKETLEMEYGAGSTDDMPTLGFPGDADSADESSDSAPAATSLPLQDFMGMFRMMSPADQLAFTSSVAPIAQVAPGAPGVQGVPVRPAVESAPSLRRPDVDPSGTAHVVEPTAAVEVAEPVVASAASTTEVPVRSLSPDEESQAFAKRVAAVMLDPRHRVTEESRAGLLFAFDTRGVDATTLVVKIPAAAASPKIIEKLTASDQKDLDLWEGPISAELEQSFVDAISRKLAHALIPFEVKCALDREVGIRSRRRLRSIHQLGSLSIDGFKITTGLGCFGNLLSTTSRAFSDAIALDPALVPFDCDALPFGHGRVKLSDEEWKHYAAITAPAATVFMQERSLISYEQFAGLTLYQASQGFIHRIVKCVLKCGKALNAIWANEVIHDVERLVDGSGSEFMASGYFVPTVDMLLLFGFNRGQAHAFGSQAIWMLSFAQATSLEIGHVFKQYSAWRYDLSLSALENLKFLVRSANHFNGVKSSVGRSDSTTRLIDEEALCCHYSIQMSEAFLGDGTVASLNSDYVHANFHGRAFATLQDLTGALVVADTAYKLRGKASSHVAGAHGVQVVQSSSPRAGMSYGRGQGNATAPAIKDGKGGKGPGNGHGKGTLPLGFDSGSSGASQSSSRQGPSSAHSGNGSVSSLSSGGSSASGRVRSYSEAMATVMDVIRSPEGAAYMSQNNIVLNQTFVRVKLPEIDETLGVGITVNRLVSFRSADWVRRVSASKRVAMALGYLRQAIDPSSDHRSVALINAQPTRASGAPAAKVNLSSAAAPMGAPSMASAAVPAPGVSASVAAAGAHGASAAAGALDSTALDRLIAAALDREFERRMPSMRPQIGPHHPMVMSSLSHPMGYGAYGMYHQYGPHAGQHLGNMYQGGHVHPRAPADSASADGAADSQAAADALVPGSGGWSAWDQSATRGP